MIHSALRQTGTVLIVGLIMTLQGCSSPSTLSTVADVDLDRYTGTWFETAKIPNRFQRKCVGNTTAQYRVLEDGSLEVVNRCLTADGSYEEARGIARIEDPRSNAKLKVSFVSLFGIHLFWGNYWIIGLDANYRYAVIGDPQRTYGWILSRKTELPVNLLNEAYQILEEKGYRVDDFEPTVQAPPDHPFSPTDK